MRRKKPPKREIIPDPKYHNVLVAKFINGIMNRGKRSLAERVFYSALDRIEEKMGESGLEVFEKAVENVKPILEPPKVAAY